MEETVLVSQASFCDSILYLPEFLSGFSSVGCMLSVFLGLVLSYFLECWGAFDDMISSLPASQRLWRCSDVGEKFIRGHPFVYSRTIPLTHLLFPLAQGSAPLCVFPNLGYFVLNTDILLSPSQLLASISE